MASNKNMFTLRNTRLEKIFLLDRFWPGIIYGNVSFEKLILMQTLTGVLRLPC